MKVLIIGSGFAGLATAALLAKAGMQVEVIEKNSGIGGRSGEITDQGFRWDTGPSWYLMPDAFDHFFELMGTSTGQELDLVDLEPGYRLFPEGRPPLDIPSNRAAAIELFESIEEGAGEALELYLDSAKDAYDLSIERFLYTTFSSINPFIHHTVRQRLGRLATLLYKSLADFVDERFSDTRLRQVLKYPAVFLSARPETTPALYHLMSYTDLDLGVKYPQGGFMAVAKAIHRLAEHHGAIFRFNTSVVAITTENKKATGLRVRNEDGDLEELPADIVVSSADLHHTETRLLPTELRTYSDAYFGKKNPGIGTVLLLLGVRGRLPELDHHNLLFSRDWSHDFDAVFSGPSDQRPLEASRSIYISMPSKTDPEVAPEDHENLFVLIPAPARTTFGYGDAYREQADPAISAIADAAIEQIAAWTKVPDLAERIVVRKSLGPSDFAEHFHAWRGGSIGPAHTLSQSAFFRGKNKSSKVADLYYAGATTLPGVGVPMCLISAENVLKRINGDTSPGPLDTVGS
ncbi:phytoene desaturase family protein [Corynebacterium sp. ES2794-CONJ1]|uniref:phytoene desaturase family protein n=1 Tax=unclassified Corynebacterium TaxID=2624378 RepID=UPI002167BAD3|nr:MULTISPECIES: phytoene desaturase family protein [unclassified Corynebacterium]MCS4490565.1 phytoene desaturase family protein [Corynebacterium sp. ES2775-CONJ]MCS4492344.1 phytoene desaturase family protein [Corynebacterium sp. ES2715-CONJ3]MCU9519859.1 phytoene desaturase family protein [Corynebacterium sp. ES2794-CONJ1]